MLVAIWLLRLVTLGAYPLVDTTEGRYGDIGREMLATGDWVMPRLEPDFPFWAKPPLSVWATAASLAVFGINEFAARFPAYVFSLGSMLLLMGLMHKAWGWMAALRGAVILSTCGLFFAMAAGVLTDPALLFCVTLSMVAFAHAVILRSPRRLWGYLFFAGVGLGVLAKGLVAIVLPGVAIGMWVVLVRGWSGLLRLPWLVGIPLFLVVAVPWHIMAEIRSPGFLQYYIIGEHYLRFVDRGWTGDLYGNAHEEPKGMIWLFALASTAPWVAIALFMAFRERRRMFQSWDPLVAFSLLWFIGPVLFFTPSDNVLMTYMLPGMPAFALCCERLIRRFQVLRASNPVNDASGESWRFVAWLGGTGGVLASIGILLILPNIAEHRSQRQMVALYMQEKGEAPGDLIYYDDMQYSGDFYARGAAKLLEEEDVRGLAQELRDDQRDFFVVDDNELGYFSEHVRGVRELQTIGEFTLFVEGGTAE